MFSVGTLLTSYSTDNTAVVRALPIALPTVSVTKSPTSAPWPVSVTVTVAEPFVTVSGLVREDVFLVGVTLFNMPLP